VRHTPEADLSYAVLRQALGDLECADGRHVSSALHLVASPDSALEFWCQGSDRFEPEDVRRRARRILRERFGERRADLLWRRVSEGRPPRVRREVSPRVASAR
jgi:hypothetical protein